MNTMTSVATVPSSANALSGEGEGPELYRAKPRPTAITIPSAPWTWIAIDGVLKRGWTVASARGRMPTRPSAKPTRDAALAPALEFANALFRIASRTRIDSGPQTLEANPSQGSLPLKAKNPFFGSAIVPGPKYTVAP